MTTVSTIGVTMDCPDPDLAATFWERFLNYRRRPARPDSPYVTIERPEGSDAIALVTFQRVPEPKTTKARVHLDLFVDHAQPMFDAMVAAGATAEWQRAFQTLVGNLWPTRDAAERWANDRWMSLGIEACEARTRATSVAAKRAMNTTLDQASKLRERAMKELTLALATYSELQARKLVQGTP